MSEEKYDPEELQALIDAALGEKTADSKALFDVGGTRILAVLEGILEEYLHPADRAFVFSQLRDVLYQDVRSERSDADRLKGLHAIQVNCRACPKAKSKPELPRWNLSDPQLVVVTDKPLSDYGDSSQLVVEGLKRAGFSSSRVAATSIVRCSSDSGKVAASMVDNCVSRYLFTELQILAPQLIMACGSVASSILAAEQIKVTEKMGSIFWVGPWPVMVGASPGYAVNSDYRKEEFFDNFKKAYAYLNGNSKT